MPGYLLEEQDFISLSAYIDFLEKLPPALQEVQRFSANYQRSGHQMVPPPSSLLLSRAAAANKMAWQAMTVATPLLGNICSNALISTYQFIEEFRGLTQSPEKMQTRIIDVDPRHFSLAKSPVWAGASPESVIDILREIEQHLQRCIAAIATFKKAVSAIGATVHSIFVRFIESLSIDLCSCHSPIPKLEVYYGLGNFSLPDMQWDPTRPYSQEERLQKAREHMARLVSMRIRVACAVDNLNDFCYRLQYLLGDARRGLLRNHARSVCMRTNYLMTLVEHPLVEVKNMADGLLMMARKFDAKKSP